MKVKVSKLFTATGKRLEFPQEKQGDLDFNISTPILYLLGRDNLELYNPVLLSISADGMRFRGMEEYVDTIYRLQESITPA